MTKPPRHVVRKILKHNQPSRALASKVDLLVYVDYVLFLKRLAERAAKHAGEDGETRVHERHVRAATVETLQLFRG
eukprot:CAMPEP_0203757256 /NCGR_PEP_ID=MMETSP0098-20131031/10384_1 /ASSEMBLY_ACC=CAM_ASM_000208 /TAXON_ID=96639 /ORGANISM=" , Strain NY0313808BC1" /LENGTH=75 /DNA_ID=CAMNT_0050649435 /DNA_START=75 /DNA_END=302 /DNA_ORIENTATION=-